MNPSDESPFQATQPPPPQAAPACERFPEQVARQQQ
jgi:hypothetical protein